MQRVLAVSTRHGRCVEPAELDAPRAGRPNSIRTTRFTLATWLPKSLFVQFKRSANIYFLCVSVLVCLDFSPVQWSSTVLPFAAVLLWTALKDLYEDLRRKRDDDAENLRSCYRWDFKLKKYTQVRWRDVLCGDVLVCMQDEAVPADILVMYAPGGEAFISTVNLDGETNLKERRAANALSAATDGLGTELDEIRGSRRVNATPSARSRGNELITARAGLTASLLLEQGMKVELAAPQASLTSMDGWLRFTTPSDKVAEALRLHEVDVPCGLNYENFVPRGCLLRNVPYIVAMVAYVGSETKTRMNCAPTEAKISNMQVYLNQGVRCLVVALACFCLWGAVFAEIDGATSPATWPDSWPHFIVRLIVYFIILYQVVPISLYVGFEILKLILGFKIGADRQMVDKVTGMPAVARTADLVEEMGQVNFLFSDKTGTLTENEMLFARACVRGTDLGDFVAVGAGGHDSPPPQGIKEARRILCQKDDFGEAVRWFYLCMATCHTARVEAPSGGDARHLYSGSSPDEVAFLESCDAVGVTFCARKRLAGRSGWELRLNVPSLPNAVPSEHSTVSDIESTGNKAVFEVLAEIPFTSERKRMTVVCRYEGELHVICKGADNVMAALCARAFSPLDEEHLMRYSRLGLRTLVFASKRITPEAFQAWRTKWTAAEARPDGREAALAAAAEDLEHSLNLAGISAIEDKLQAGVPEAIVTIKAAGIRFWVLTGDKTETAVEIVRACRLFTEDMHLASLVGCRGIDHAIELLEAARGVIFAAEQTSTSGTGLVLDGTFVTAALASEEASKGLYELAVRSRACVCCRLSPQQKRKLVELVRKHNSSSITMAVGDGANDVSMIQGAHVGIGIRGKEGCQAVQASDVAISQFRFLVPLLLCHGRRAYRRVAVFLCFMIYKHVALAVGDAIWAHQCAHRFYGQIAYPDWLSACFPALITGLPVLVTLCWDQDVPDVVAQMHPELYSEGANRIHFNMRVMAIWVLTAIWHGSVAWLVPSIAVGSTSSEAHTGPAYEPREFWAASCLSFLLVVTFINFRLWLHTYSPLSGPTLLVFLQSFGTMLLVLFALGHLTVGIALQPQLEGIPSTLFTNSNNLGVLFGTPLVFVLDIAWVYASAALRPTPLDSLRQRVSFGRHNSGVALGVPACSASTKVAAADVVSPEPSPRRLEPSVPRRPPEPPCPRPIPLRPPEPCPRG